MSSQSSPPILPISTTTTTTSQQPQQPPPIAQPAIRSFVTNITNSVQNGFQNRRPWLELLDRNQFSKPESLTDATSRLRKNYHHFRVNYLTVISLILAFSLLSHPFALLLLLSLLASWCFCYLFRSADQPLVAFGRTFSDRETLGILIVFSIFVVFMTSVGPVLVSALMAGVAVVCVHGAFRVPDDLFLDEPDGAGNSASTGFLSAFLGATTVNNVGVQPAAGSRV